MQLSFRKTSWELYYDLMRTWWEERKSPVPDRAFLPATGLVIWLGEIPLCAGMLFKTDAKIAIIGHIVSNPIVPGTMKWARSESIDELICALFELAKSDGFKLVTASSSIERLNARYEKLGFLKSNDHEVHYGRVV